jgi:toxin ParE1/3/4
MPASLHQARHRLAQSRRGGPAWSGIGSLLGEARTRNWRPRAHEPGLVAREAIADLAALRAYIAQDDPATAQRVALDIVRDVETLLPNSLEMGRPGRVPGTSELAIPEHAIDRAVPSRRQHNPSPAGLPQCAPLT